MSFYSFEYRLEDCLRIFILKISSNSFYDLNKPNQYILIDKYDKQIKIRDILIFREFENHSTGRMAICKVLKVEDWKKKDLDEKDMQENKKYLMPRTAYNHFIQKVFFKCDNSFTD